MKNIDCLEETERMKIRTRRNPSPNESLSMCSFIPEGCAGVCGQVSVVIFSSIPNLVGCLFTWQRMLLKHKDLFRLNKTKNELTLVKMLQNENRQSSKASVSKVQIPVTNCSIVKHQIKSKKINTMEYPKEGRTIEAM